MWTLIRTIDRLSSGVGLTGAILVLPLCGVMVYEVFARFVLDLPTFWAYELAWMTTGAHFALGMALVTLRRQHVRVDFLYGRYRPRVQALLDAVVMGCFIFPLGCWVSWALMEVAHDAFVLRELSGESGWNPVVWPLRLSVFVGFTMFTLQVFSEVMKLGYFVITGREA